MKKSVIFGTVIILAATIMAIIKSMPTSPLKDVRSSVPEENALFI